MPFTYDAKRPGDMLRSQDWNAAMLEVERLETAKVNRDGADKLKGPLTIADALLVNGNAGIGTTTPSEKLEIRQTGGNGQQTNFLSLHNDGNAATQESRIVWKNGSGSKLAAAIASRPGSGYNQGDLRLQTAKDGVLGDRLLITHEGNVGIGTSDPKGKLSVVGTVSISDGAGHAVSNNHMASGSLTVGSINTNYGGGSGWSTNVAALLLETSANTEIAVHDSGTRIASLLYYEGQTNQVTIGRDMGWGNLTALNIRTGGVGNWNRLVVNTTSEWGDGNTQYVTIGSGGADGIMISNPHVTWRTNRASIRYGRSGGVSSGAFWDVGVRSNGAFSFGLNGDSDHKLWLTSNGTLGIGTTTPDANTRLDIEGCAFLGYENATDNFGRPLKSGFYQNVDGRLLPDTSHGWAHLITSRHTNTTNNHQLQIAASYGVNDRLFFRKIAATGTDNPGWNEVATRGSNTFFGGQTVNGDLGVSQTIYEGGTALRDKYLPQGFVSDRIRSGDGRYTLVIQSDRNLVIYEPSGRAAWASNTNISDIHLKEQIKPIDNALTKLLSLRGVSFFWKDKTFGADQEIGLIAQEVEEVFPELLQAVNETSKLVKYEKFVAVLIEAVREQQNLISQLQSEFQGLKEVHERSTRTAAPGSQS